MDQSRPSFARLFGKNINFKDVPRCANEFQDGRWKNEVFDFHPLTFVVVFMFCICPEMNRKTDGKMRFRTTLICLCSRTFLFPGLCVCLCICLCPEMNCKTDGKMRFHATSRLSWGGFANASSGRQACGIDAKFNREVKKSLAQKYSIEKLKRVRLQKP